MLKGVSGTRRFRRLGTVQNNKKKKKKKAGDYQAVFITTWIMNKSLKMSQTEAKAKPDFLDMDKDGNKKEPTKKAIKDKEAKKDKKESIDYKEELAEELNRVLSKKKTERH